MTPLQLSLAELHTAKGRQKQEDLLISTSLGYCPLAPWLTYLWPLVFPCRLCGMSPGASSPFKFPLLWFYTVSLRVWLVATSLDLSAFRLIKSMVKRMICGTAEQIMNKSWEGDLKWIKLSPEGNINVTGKYVFRYATAAMGIELKLPL